MIPKASQRGLGQDLAAHLMNARDNDRIEIADLRGAVARDLSGAFAEWELQADTLTRCQNYLYSLSVNPDPSQGDLTRGQYLDYIDRAEQRLGLAGQPRAVVFHVKYGREHCHVVWSRIDAANERAVHLALDRRTLMVVTREFARDHGLSLPEGYRRGRGERTDKSRRLSLYEKHQYEETGISKTERIEQVTDAWRRRDSPQAFVRALEDQGYVLATGKRPYVLVDLYGEMNALPKLIDDRQVRTKDIRAFLERAYPTESLPTVEQARALVANHLRKIEVDRAREADQERRDTLAEKQVMRRAALEEEKRRLLARQRDERQSLRDRQSAERRAALSAFLEERARIQSHRAERNPRGLAAFLGRITGVSLISRKLQRRRDKQRLDAFRAERAEARTRQTGEEDVLLRRQDLQRRELDRKSRALDRLDRRERRSLDVSVRRDARILDRGLSENRGVPALARGVNRDRHVVDTREAERVTRPANAFDRASEREALEAGPPNLRDDFQEAVSGHATFDGKGRTGGGRRFGIRRFGRRRSDDRQRS